MSSASGPARQFSPTWTLIGATGLMGAIWLVVLPWLAELPRMREHLEWLDQRGLDPSSRYYTDLPAMKPILRRLENPPLPHEDARSSVSR